ncbi:MAG: hypothetical protein N2509_00350 [Treponemataceae bacterium]|nr:hypothetical protein [Treponemataceae bacterium]
MASPIEQLPGWVYQALPEFVDHLEKELGSWDNQWGPLYYRRIPTKAFWVQNIWLNPFMAHFTSISEAARLLKSIQRNWAPLLVRNFRRGQLIQEQLPHIPLDKPREFPFVVPPAPMGAWTLFDEHTLLASAHTTSPFPGGTIQFVENKIDPPSRAYLKLQEALVRLGAWPGPGDLCIDAGASPGGWTWVLTRLGAQVIAIDRAPLAPHLMEHPLVRYVKHDAFTLKPQDLGPVDWVFSDVICYPPRLFGWIEQWLSLGLAKNYVCTIKMQGDPDMETTARFAAIPGSTVVHLSYNKHELTWLYRHPGESTDRPEGKAVFPVPMTEEPLCK